MPMHTLTWLIWLITAGCALNLAPNPLYVSIIFLVVLQVFVHCRSASPLAQSFGLFLRVGAFIFVGYLLFSLITVGGMRGATQIVSLPRFQLPAWLGGLVLGGPISAEDLAWGAARGLQIWALLLLFGTFNALVDHYRLLRMAPGALFYSGLAITIAIAFVPGLLRSIGEISQAQRARGHRFGSPKSWLALVAPLLAGSLEKSVQLAESLDSRGYGRSSASPRALILRQIALLVGLGLLVAGLFAWLYYGSAVLISAATAASAGSVLLIGTVYSLGRLVQRSSYQRERWRRGDTLVAVACGVCLTILSFATLSGHAGLSYYPFPQISPPDFDLSIGLALLLLATPAWAAQLHKEPVRSLRRQQRARQHQDESASS